MILVTGGCGYIGSHAVVELLGAGYDVVVVDNLSNSSIDVVSRITKVAKKDFFFREGDIRNLIFLKNIFSEFPIESVLHFAGLKSIGESIVDPLGYYDNNLAGSLSLFRVMNEFNVQRIIFSSSATVYGAPDSLPLRETAPVGNTSNPYGASKYFVERLMMDMCAANSSCSAIALRYFNPAGAHSSGLIGESPNGIPNNLMPFVTRVAGGRLDELLVYGNDYDTVDGTGVRDYIHVVDLAKGHIAALDLREKGFKAINLGTGKGHSVLEVVETFGKVTNRHIEYRFVQRRPGDLAEVYADPSLARHILGWEASYSLEDMIRHSWKWENASDPDFS